MLLRFLISICVAQLAVPLCAQGVSSGPLGTKLSGFGEVDGAGTVEFWAENERQNTLDEFNLHIDLIREVCQLTEAEADKLRLAAKGVTTRRVSAGKEQLFKFIVDSELIAKVPDGVSVKDKYPNKLRAFGAASLDRGIVYLQTEFAIPATEDPLWTNILKSTLSGAQLQLLNDNYIVRNKAFLQSAIAMAISDLDQRIFLNDSQKSNVLAYFLKQFDSEVTPQFPSSITQARNFVRPAFQEWNHFQSLLRPAQLNRLKTIADQPRSTVGWGSPSR